jgi:hypothetical protein
VKNCDMKNTLKLALLFLSILSYTNNLQYQSQFVDTDNIIQIKGKLSKLPILMNKTISWV